MVKRAFAVLVVAILGLGWAASPARSQVAGLRFEPPLTTLATGSFEVRWSEPEALIGDGLPSITWYYASQKDGSDRKRIVTAWSESWQYGVNRNWKPAGPIAATGWLPRKDEQRGGWMMLARDPGPIVSVDAMDRDSVVSVLMRPSSLSPQVAVAIRVQGNGAGYELRLNGNQARLTREGDKLEEERIPNLEPRRWYWLEVGASTFNREARIRARIMDEKREKVLLDLSCGDRPANKSLVRGGAIALWGPGDFGAVYVDPWCTRWPDDQKNQLNWDTRGVPVGDYYVIAELLDDRNQPQLITSDYQVRVRKPE